MKLPDRRFMIDHPDVLAEHVRMVAEDEAGQELPATRSLIQELFAEYWANSERAA